jgi:hypothetical protein
MANPASVGNSITLTATVTAQPPGAGLPTGTVTFSDGTTVLGTATLQVINGVAQASFTTSALALGNHSITAAYRGDPNFTASTSPAFTQEVHKATTTKLTAPASSVWGQAITLKTTVKAVASGSGTPTGTVTFMDGSTVLGTATLQVVNGVAQASLSVSTLAVGNHSLMAVYGGDSVFGISSSTAVNETVNQAQTKVTLTSSANPAVWGQSVTFTAVVSAKAPGAGTPTGLVTFLDGSTVLGLAALQVVNGVDKAVFSTSSLSVGSHSITAVYSGDSNFVTSTSAAVTETINKAHTTTGLSSSNPSAPPGTTVILTAMVLPVSPGSGTPTGTVSLYDGSTLIGTVNLSSGVATLSYTLPAHYRIKAVYNGDSDFLSSTSSVLT